MWLIRHDGMISDRLRAPEVDLADFRSGSPLPTREATEGSEIILIGRAYPPDREE